MPFEQSDYSTLQYIGHYIRGDARMRRTYVVQVYTSNQYIFYIFKKIIQCTIYLLVNHIFLHEIPGYCHINASRLRNLTDSRNVNSSRNTRSGTPKTSRARIMTDDHISIPEQRRRNGRPKRTVVADDHGRSKIR